MQRIYCHAPDTEVHIENTDDGGWRSYSDSGPGTPLTVVEHDASGEPVSEETAE